MSIRLFYIAFSFVVISNAESNSNNYRIFGKVYDKETQEELIGASVYLLDKNKGTITDFEGNYELKEISSGKHLIVCQYISYQTDTIELNLNHDTEYNFELIKETITLGSVELISKVDRKEEAYVVNVQKKSAGLINTLSKKQMRITGSSNAADAVKNVSGVNVQAGKYVYVRGLSDRYSLAVLNGVSLPSLDPNKNSVQMDLIPANIIDNILVYKTFTPDLPASFTGGLVNVVTSDFPDSLEVQFNYTTGYSNLSNLNENFAGQARSSSDWLGFDAGLRSIPSFVQENGVNSYAPSSYEDAFYFAQSQDETYANMTLDDVRDANGNYYNWSDRGEWLEKARIFANDSLSIATQSFSNNWDLERFRSGLNQSFSFSLGNKYEIWDKEFGFNSGLTYKKRFNYYEDAEIGRYTQTEEGVERLLAQKLGHELRGDENVFASIFLTGALNFNEKNRLKFTSMLNQNGQSSARYFLGENRSDDNGLFEEQRTQRYLERQLFTNQLSGIHEFSKKRQSELAWNIGYTKSYQNTPDLRVFTNSFEYLLVEDEDTGDFYQDTVPTYAIRDDLYPVPTRYFRFLEEDNVNFKIDYKLDFNSEEYLKIGSSFLHKERENKEYRYGFKATGIEYENNLDDFFSSSNMVVGSSLLNNGGSTNHIELIDFSELSNQFTANQSVFAFYLMSKFLPIDLLEFTGGLRVESAKINAISIDPSKLQGNLSNIDVLPSLNLKYSLDESIHIRASYGKTLARPSFREISPISWYDFTTNYQFTGNPDLERTLIDNFDLRLEKYLPGAGLLSMSVFFKNFINPIEQVMNVEAQNVELSWRNVKEAVLFGLEFEFKKKIVLNEGEYLNIGFNTSLIKSSTQIDKGELELIRAFDPEHSDTRRMYGQSPYIINAYSQYQNNGWNIGANFNVSGESIVIVQKGAVDVYQAPRPILNFNVAKQISEKSRLALSANNLLSARNLWYYPYKAEEYIFSSFFYSPEFRISFQFSL